MKIAIDDTPNAPTVGGVTTGTTINCFICMKHEEWQKDPVPLCVLLHQSRRTIPKSAILPTTPPLGNTLNASDIHGGLIHMCNGHVHLECIREWLETDASCPMCRSNTVVLSDAAMDTDATNTDATITGWSKTPLRKKRNQFLTEEEIGHVACVSTVILCCVLFLLILCLGVAK